VPQLSSTAPKLQRENGRGLADSLYRAIVDTAVDAIVVIDRDGAIRSVNNATERLFGYAVEELIGNNVKMLMPEPYAGEHDTYLANYLGTGHKKIIGIGREVVGRRKNGSVFPMDLSVGEARDGAEPIFVGIIRDITDRKAAELAQRESELRVRSILDTVPDAIVVIDAQGMIQSFSPAAERLFGYDRQEVAGRNVNILMPTPYREAHDGYLDRYIRTGERRIIGIGRVVVGSRKNGDLSDGVADRRIRLRGQPLFYRICPRSDRAAGGRTSHSGSSGRAIARVAAQRHGADGLDDGA